MTTKSFEAGPGQLVNIVNNLQKALRVRVVTACGTETAVDLHPGANVHITVGTITANIQILDVDETYTGLQIVR